MKKSQVAAGFGSAWFWCGACLICAVLIKPVQDHLETQLGPSGPDPDLLYFSSPAVVKKLALGYDGFLADFYWMRVIQYYGRREEAEKRPVRYKNLSTLLDITTTLDPDLLDAYRAGCTFLSEPEPIGAGQPKEAIKLLDKGINVHPQEWRLWFDKGFVYFWYLKDFKASGETWLSASRLSSAPPWMISLAAMSLSKGGAVRTARALWERQYQESNRADVRENARNHLISIQVAEELWTLEFLVEKFRARNGYFPRSLEELAGAQPVRRIIADPSGTPYEYNPETGAVKLSPQTKVRYLEVPENYKDEWRMTIGK